MTKKLYDLDSHRRDFTAAVLRCDADGERYAVVLDQTLFFPEGGGQPADTGVLGGARVLDVQITQEAIVHYTDAPLTPGAQVRGEIDWPQRFRRMQGHSGEHIISGLLCSTFHCDNVGFHMGAEVVTIDYNAPITWEQALEVERRANAYIWADHPIRIWYPSPEELAALPYRSKKALTGPVRITEFPGADMCACCGTHVASSGQVGLVKLLSCQKFRDGVRLELLCGQRALDYLSAGWEQAREIGQALSVKPQSAFAAVSRMQEELLALKEKAARLEEAAFAHTAEQYRNAGSVLHITEKLDGDGTRRLCDAIARAAGGRCAVFAGSDGGYQYAVIESGGDLRPLIKDMNAALHGRGGGRDGFAQGSAACTAEEIRTFFAGL